MSAPPTIDGRPVRVVLQARLSSSRLPAKAMLPIAGVPSAVLATQRAGNTGLAVVVATSDDASDDLLAQTVAEAGLPVFRGSLDDVLGRFLGATSDLSEDAIVVRITGDNVFPDGTFIGDVVAQLAAGEAEYLGTSEAGLGLPYGLSVEAMTVGALRRAGRHGTLASEREHVTPWIRRNCRRASYRLPPAARADWSILRCTLDDVGDYRQLCRVFAGLADPVSADWRDLVQRLQQINDAPCSPGRVRQRAVAGRMVSELTAGTAQLGLPYGVANRSGQPGDAEVDRILHELRSAGVNAFDTARAYGSSEQRLGGAFARQGRRGALVVTKLDPFEGVSEARLRDSPAAQVDASVFRSCHALRQPSLDVLMLHRWAHRLQAGEGLWKRLRELRDQGVIGALGASVSTPQEAMAALADPDIRALQVPCNLLDWRWRTPEFEAACQQRDDVMVFARSALLQGLLAGGPELWPAMQGVDAAAWIRAMDGLVAELGRASRADLCFAYVRGQPWVSSVVVGMETAEQARQNVELFVHPPLEAEERQQVERTLAGAPEELLNPALWYRPRTDEA